MWWRAIPGADGGTLGGKRPLGALPGRRTGAHIPVKELRSRRSESAAVVGGLTRGARELVELSKKALRTLGVLLLFAAVLFLAVPSVSGSLTHPSAALPHEAPATLAKVLSERTPTPKGVPAGMVKMTAANHPCWPINKNQTACIQVDVANFSQPDVIPDPRSGALNTSWRLYPAADQDIHFQVLSTYDLANCNIYNPPAWMGGCTPGANGGPATGPQAMYSGWDAYLYLTVVDVMWQDVCWFCDNDGTQWHANAGQTWSPQAMHPYSGDATHRWVADLNISAFGGNGAENFPNGTWVMWNVSTNYWNGTSSGGPLNIIRQCAPSCSGGVTAAPQMFYYFTRNFWYYDSAPLGVTPPYGPNYANMVTGGGPNAFAANVNLSYFPVVPAIGDQVFVDLKTQSVENFSGGAINIRATLIVLNAWYPNGTFWRTWASGFTPLAYPYNNTWHARVTLPLDFFAHSGTRVQWFIQAYDSYGHMVQSRNFTQIVSKIGECPNGNFTACLNVTTVPPAIETEGWKGWLNTTPPSIPGVGINQDVNVTITTFNRSVDIQAAYIIIHVTYATTGGSGAALYTMHRITFNQYYFDIPGLPEGSNVTFVIKAYDFNLTNVLSHPYKFFVPFEVFPPAAYCFFYIFVYNAATDQPVNGANVTIIGLAGTIHIATVTSLNGAAYPNVTGQPWTPRFLPANNSFTIRVQIRGFVGVGLAPPDTIRTNLFCTHVMNKTQVLAQTSNYQAVLKNSVLNITINSPPPPPIFSAAVFPGIGVGVAGGMIATGVILIPVYLYWRKLREVAEAEEKRITL
ncbi:MAG: hypothetical protein KGJ23_14205 [Euryarchaeota archaeon]|nr:hypothetical protein [Euryarchaeota archaeon]MDE2045426.1 hypothetical protein [Thermoplasmata archaeon]